MIKIAVSADAPEEVRAVAEAIRQHLHVVRVKAPEERKNGKLRLFVRASIK